MLVLFHKRAHMIFFLFLSSINMLFGSIEDILHEYTFHHKCVFKELH